MSDITTPTQFKEQLEKDASCAKRGLLLTAILGAVIVVAMAFYLSYLNSNLRILTEEREMATLMRGYVELEVLPELKPTLRNALLTQVPAAVDNLAQDALQQLPEFRAVAVGAVSDYLRTSMHAVGRDLSIRLKQDLMRNKDRLDSLIVQSGGEDRQQRIKTELVAMFREEYTHGARMFVREFQMELNKVDRDLRILLMTDNSELTREQKERKELLLLAIANLETLVTTEGGHVVDTMFRVIGESVNE